MKYLVTGAAGFIGRHLCSSLDGEVIGLDVLDSPCTTVQGDVTESAWKSKVSSIDVIFHLAALVGVDKVSQNPEGTYHNSIQGMKQVIDFASKTGAGIVFASSSAVYGDRPGRSSETMQLLGSHPYALGKIHCERMLQQSGIRYSILRLFNVYGPGQKTKMVIARFVDRAAEGKPLHIYGTTNRDFTYIDDVIPVMIAFGNRMQNLTVNVGHGASHSILDCATSICEFLDSDSSIIKTDVPKHRVSIDVTSREADTTLLKSLGFSCPTCLKEGLTRIIEF